MVDQEIKPISAEALLNAPRTPLEPILGNVITKGSLTMVYGKRGSGKTFIGWKLIHTAVTGGRFCKWTGTKVRGLIVDMEMRSPILADRLQSIDEGASRQLIGDELQVITLDQLGGHAWNFCESSDRKAFVNCIGDAEVVLLDNYNRLTSETRECQFELQQWKRWEKLLVWLRNQNKAVILIHHSGKSGEQLGTSQRENLMDTVIEIQQDKTDSDNLSMILQFTKARNFFGADSEGLYITMANHPSGGLVWDYETLYARTVRLVLDLEDKGLKPKQIADELRINTSEVFHILRANKKQTEKDSYDNMF